MTRIDFVPLSNNILVMSPDSFCGDRPGGEVAVARAWPCSADSDTPRKTTSRYSEESDDAAKLNRSPKHQRSVGNGKMKDVAERGRRISAPAEGQESQLLNLQKMRRRYVVRYRGEFSR